MSKYVYDKDYLRSFANSTFARTRPEFLLREHDTDTGLWCPERSLFSSWDPMGNDRRPMVIPRRKADQPPAPRPHTVVGAPAALTTSSVMKASANTNSSLVVDKEDDWSQPFEQPMVDNWRHEAAPEWYDADIDMFDTVELKGFDDDDRTKPAPRPHNGSRFSAFFDENQAPTVPKAPSNAAHLSNADLAHQLHNRITMGAYPTMGKGNPLSDPRQRASLLHMLQQLAVKQGADASYPPPPYAQGYPPPMAFMPPPPPFMPPPPPHMMGAMSQPPPHMQHRGMYPPPPMRPSTVRATPPRTSGGQAPIADLTNDKDQREMLVNAAKVVWNRYCDALTSLPATAQIDRHAMAAATASISPDVLTTAMDVLKKSGFVLQEGKALGLPDVAPARPPTAAKASAVTQCLDQLRKLEQARQWALQSGNESAARGYETQMSVLSKVMAEQVPSYQPALARQLPVGAKVINSDDLERSLISRKYSP